MTELSQKQRVSRRTVVKGAAWAAPVVAMASAAPAFAASPPENTSINGYVVVSGSCKWNWPNSRRGTLDYDSRSGNYGLFINNTTTSTTISNPSIIFYVSVSGLTWTTGEGNIGWSAPVSTGGTISRNGVTFYGYKSTLSPTTVPATKGTTKLSALHVIASQGGCFTSTVSVVTERHVIINGTERSYDNGITSLHFSGGRAAMAKKGAEAQRESPEADASATAEAQDAEAAATPSAAN